MHNNYYTFKKLSQELSTSVEGKYLSSCFSQSKDELILIFNEGKTDVFFIKASLKPEFTCLSFPTNFARANRNSIDLFDEFVNHKVRTVRQYSNERCFHIEFENDQLLLFKMHGNRSNILAYDANHKVTKLFRNNFPADYSLNLSELDRPLEQTFEKFTEYSGNYKKVFPTFGKLISQYLKSIDFEQKPLGAKWEILELIRNDIDKPKAFYIIEFNGQLYFSLIPLGKTLHESNSAIEGLTQYYYTYSKEYFIRKEKSLMLKKLDKRRSQITNYISKSSRKLQDIKEKTAYNKMADIIMANLHAIPEHAEEVELFNFYTNEMISIPLKSTLSPQKNAENLYRKSKNQKIELNQIESAIAMKEKELEQVEADYNVINETEDFKDIKKLSKKFNNIIPSQKEERLPYRKFEYENYTILVGKGARENDELTLKHAKKNDLFLHAKDVTGSHVILKHKANKPFPNYLIEKAAQLAAFYSKRKTDSLVPVLITEKKYVRKPKGLPAGKVHIDKEESILVKPEMWWNEQP